MKKRYKITGHFLDKNQPELTMYESYIEPAKTDVAVIVGNFASIKTVWLDDTLDKKRHVYTVNAEGIPEYQFTVPLCL